MQNEFPPINWLGGYILVRELLRWSKADKEENDPKSFINKINSANLCNRVTVVVGLLHQHGVSMELVEDMQSRQWFTDFSKEVLLNKIVDIVKVMRNSSTLWRFNAKEFGTLQFNKEEAAS